MKIQSEINELEGALTSIGMNDEARKLKTTQARTSEKGLRILVTGEYSRGKSMLINALLGEEILATSLLRLPVVNIVRGGEKRSAHVLRDGRMDEIEFAVIPELKDVSRIEITWDSAFFKDGIELIEYPSMSEAPDREAFRQEVEQADLVVVVVACDSLYSNVEAGIIESVIRACGHRKILFVANFLDRIAPKDIDEVKRAAAVRLPVNQDRIFFVSAQNAIDGDKTAKSSITDLRDKIREEASGRESLKTSRIKQLASDSIEAALLHLSQNEQNADEQRAKVEKDVAHVRKMLRSLQDLNTQLQLDLHSFRNGTRDVLQGKISNFIQDLALNAENWGRDFNGGDLVAHLNHKLKESTSEFFQQNLATYLNDRLAEQNDLLTNGFKRYQQQLNSLFELLPDKAPEMQQNPGVLNLSPTLQEFILNNEALTKDDFPLSSLFQDILKTPGALIVLVGTIAGSIFLKKYAIILAPVGIGVTAFLVLQTRRKHNIQDELKLYTAQIREKAGQFESKVMAEMNEKIDQFHAQIIGLLKTTTDTAQKSAMSKIEELQAGLKGKTGSEVHETLERIRNSLQEIK